MDVPIVITEWALDSYLQLRRSGELTEEAYWSTVRPDVLRLRALRTDPAFRDGRFWGPAQSGPGVAVPHGWKMKWHNLGAGLAQLRLCVALVDDVPYLCHAYHKTQPQMDFRAGLRLSVRIQLIRAGKFTPVGAL